MRYYAISSATMIAAKFEERKETLRNIEKKINQKWGRGTASLTITDQ